ncbi:tandem-95 repeat protein [Rhizobacter sp. AJA081-3]|uniref:VCBS domain-containing protein n=1 Tax=Rhizobacter sp. AJA081-3 TaxID=2753607 RepID=UPI001AE042CB|nr:VCBS domain-containing protein [Rhizobacter sp. AJA081-3]QTN21344.1 tandem-95 repeat protein [Rhizobacter sp. AJA081-3]
MPVIARSPEGKVVSLWGTALIRGADGQLRVLKVGDMVRKGDQILTTQNGIVQISNGDEPTPAAEAKAPADNDVDRAISELNSGDRQAAPAAGLAGGEGGSLEAALRVDRIAEPLGAGVLPRAADETTVQTQPDGTGTAVAEPDPAPGLPALGAPSSAISTAEEGSTTNLGLAAPTGPAANGSIRVDQVPAVGEIRKADGTLVTAGTVLTPADLPGLVYTPPADYDGVAPVGNFSYTLTADGQTVTGGTTITLAAVNDPPVATPATLTGNEDGALPVSLGGTDVDGRIVGVTVTSIPAGATLLLADGVTPVLAGQTLTPEQAATLLFRPAADFSGNQTLLFTVTDNGGAVSAPAAVSMTVVAVNDLPVPLASSGGSGSEDSPVAVRLGGTDVDGTVTSVTVTTLPGNGTLYLADGVTPVVSGTPLTPAQAASLVFVPNPDFNGNVTIGFTVTDNDGATSAPASAVVAVAPVNDGPVAGNDGASFAEDSVATGNVLGNDSDVDGPSLSVTSFVFGGVSFPAGSTAIVGGVGTLVINADGSWNFTPAANFTGPVPAIQVTTTDGSLSATSTLSLTVTPVNDAPLAQDDLASTPINTPATIAVLANDSDVEGEALTVTGASLANPAQGTVTVNPDGTLGFVPALNFTGTATITYTVRDASGASTTATVTVNVGNNTAPDGADVTRSLPEDGSYTVQAGDFGFTDADAGQTLANVRIDSLPAAGALLLNGVPVTAGTVVSLAQLAAGDLTFVPAVDGNGAPYASFGFSVQDSSGGFDTTPNTFRFDVTPVNDAPVAAIDTASTNEDTALTLTPATLLANDSDVDGDTLFITSVQGAVNGSVALVGGNVVFTPAANYNGPASFTYTVIDGNGGSSTATVNLTINAVGDAALISAGAGSVTEDVGVTGGNLSTGGTLTITDPDAGEASFQAQAVNGAYGSFSLGTNGVWTYVASNTNPAIQALGAGDTLTETFTVTSADGTSSSVVVTINGTNDAAVISAGTGSVTEDVGVVGGNIATGGTLTIADADAGEATFTAQTTAGAYGSFTLGTNGVWTYTAANTNPAIQALGVGATLTETFTVTSADGTTSSVVVTINGTNDAAVISAGTGAVTEDVGVVGGNIATGGTLTISDADSGEASFAAQTTAGTYGSFSLGTNGVWTYTASNTNPAIQALGAGDTLTETFTVTSADGTTSSVVVTINGTNDAAVISAGTGSVTEDVGVTGGNIATGGTLTISDADSGEATFTAQTAAGTYGTFTLGTNGVWTYTAANTNLAIQALGTGDTLTETFTVTSADGTTSSVVVTINGTNDVAVISTGTGSVTEDVGVVGGNITTGGTLTISDADNGEATFTAQTTAGTYGSFSLAANGTWTYVASNTNPAIQALGTGDTLTETFTVTSADGTSSSVVVTINGTNDAAVISAGTGSVTEDVGVVGGNIATGGTLTISDADGGEATFTAQTTAGSYGSFTLGTNGVWTYTAPNTNPAIQALGVGATLTETFTVTSADGTTSSVVVAINGTNDGPVAQANALSTDEDTALTIAPATLLANDSDLDGDTLTIATVQDAVNGSVALVGGNVVFTPAANYNGPASFTYTVSDGNGGTSTATVNLTINPVNDVPTANADTASTAINTTLPSIAVLANDSDADGDTLTVTSATLANPALGSVSINPDGTLAFTPALNVAGLVIINYTISDGQGGTSGATLSVNVGANNAPTGTDATITIAEDGSRALTAADFGFADADLGQTLAAVRIDALPAAGTLTLGGLAVVAGQVIDAADFGQLVYAPAPNANGNGYAGFTFSVQDSAGAFDALPNTITVNVTPAPDAAVISGVAVGTTVEDTTLSSGGQLLVSDPDAGEAAFQPQVNAAGTYGSLTIDAGGAWSYALNNGDPVVQSLGQGETRTDTFTVRSIDGTPQLITITVTGTNDAAVLSAGTGSVTEDTSVVAGNLSTGGTLTIADADAGEASFQAQATNGAYGSFSLATNGSWSYVASNSSPAIQALGAGDTLTETFTVTSDDGTTSSVVVTINGTNDAAVISAGTGSVTEDVGVVGGNIAAGGTLTIADADAGEATFTAQTTAGAYGSFTLGTNGVWTYTASNTNPAIQTLGTGDTLTETFTVTSADGTSSSVVVTINGTNDAAVISAGTGSVTEDVGVVGGNIATGGTLTISDADSGEASFTAQTTAGTYGSFSLGANGVWTYSASNTNPAIQALGTGDTLTETFTVTSADGTTSSVVVTINGTNDAAVISAGTGSVTEDVGVVGGNIATGGTLTISDADSGEATFTAQTAAGTYGTFTLGTNGVWTYTASNTNPAIQALGVGDTLTETFTVTSADGTNSSVVVTINGTNDAAVISAGTGSVTEDVAVNGGNIATGGTLAISDADSGEASFTAQTTAGTYGSFTLATNGVWTYTALNTNPAIQALGTGDTLTETFTVTSADGTTSSVVVTINGTNDAAVISAGTGSVTEDVGVVGGNIATGGTLTISDADSGEAAFTAQTTAGSYGIFTLAPNGVWTYTALNTNPAIQALGTGDTLTETFTVTSADGTTSSVVVTINGTNDVAVISAGTGSVTEDVGVVGGNIATGGTLTISDADSGEANFTAQTTAGTYGSFTLATNGVWTYTALNTNPAIQALGTGDTLTETFTVTAADGTTSSVVVTINGTNDAAVISAGTGSVTEDVGVVGGNIATGGTLTISDADSGEASFTAQTTAGTYGSFSLGTNGVWTYTASNTNPAIQALGAGDTLTETFTVTSADGTTSSVVVTINGTNDAAVISAGTGSVTEDVGVVGGNIATGGTLAISDADSGEASFTAQTTSGTYGNFTLGTNGVWSYTALNTNPAIQALGTGATLTETFTVTSADGTTSSVVVTINGTNDAAVISAGTGSVTEDVGVVGGNIATGGTLTISDADSGEASFTAQSTAGTYGSFTLAANGVWTYSALNTNPAIQALGTGDTLTETFTVTSADGTTSSVVVTINGTNDAAVISAGTGSVTEDVGVVGGNIATGGTLTISDADGGEASFTAQSTAGAYGSFTLGTNGVWTYVASNTNPAIQALGAGDTLTETFTVTSADGTTSSVVVTINGTNDAAVISAGTGSVTEDVAVNGGNIATGGTLTISDADAGEATFTAQTTAGTYGSFTLGTNGVWTYTASNTNPAIQALGTGDTLTETFTVTAADGTTSSVVVTINGTNDAAVISAGTGSVTEDVGVVGGNIATGGTLTISDADSGEANFTAQTTAGTYGSFTLATNGVWTYTALNTNPAIQALGTGDTLTETFTVTSADGTTSSVVVTINGTNDAAVISAGTGSVTEDVGVVGGNIATGGTLTISDADSGEAAFTAQTTAGSYGIFTLAPNGVWTYTALNTNPAIQALGTGDTLTETFTVTSADGTNSSVVVTINGTNDAAVISAGTGSVTEDVGVVGGNIATGGTLTISDADSGEASFTAQTTTGTYGTFTLAANGVWSYTALNANPAIQALGAGDTLTETFTVTSADGTTSSVVVTINGTNDAAVISAGTGSVTEDVGVVGGNIATGGTLTISDADSGEAAFTAQTTAGTYGSFTLGTNGVWNYTASNSNPAIQALGTGDTLTETFTVTSADGTTSSVVVTINGTNDAAVISAGTGSVTEDVAVNGGNIATGGTLTISDADSGEASFTAQTTAGTYGSFTLATNGVWTYTALNANPAVQALGTGDTLTETFTVTSADGTTSSVVVTINGTNDAAVISAGSGSITEDVGVVGGNIATGGTLTISDADSGEASFTAQSTSGTYGNFTLGTNGVWTYVASNTNPAIQALGTGDTLTETFTVTSADGTTSSVVVTINGTNDAAVISAGTGSVTEDVGVVGGNIATGGTLAISDADSGEASFTAQSTVGTYGTFVLAANGVWTYSASNTNPAIQALGTGDTLTETFTVTSADGTTSSVVVTINGTNDAAVISAGTGSVTEDVGVVGGNIATGGTLTISDADSGEASFTAQSSAGTYGNFTLGTNGVWTYVASNTNPAIQALGAGDTLTETFTVTSADGTTSSVVVTINGTNDAAVISAGTGSVTEDVAVNGGNIATGGTLTISDADSGEASFTPQTTAGTYGSFTLGANGVWTYVAANSNPAIQALGIGQTLTETFTVTSADGTSSSVVVTLRGTNDAAVISAGTGSVTEDVGVVGGNIATGGTLTISDADSGEASFTAQTTAGTYGSFTLGTNGVWTYTALNTTPAIQALGTGDTLTETFTVTAADGTTSSVVVTINGTNDAAVISAGTGSVTEDVGVVGGNIATGGTLTISDADSGEASFTAQTTAGTYGSFSLGTNGVWTYTASNTNPAIQALGTGDTLTETFTVTSADGTSSSIVVTINGTNDAAVISAGTGSVTEDVGVVGGNIATGGTLTISDADSGEATFTAQTTAGTYGSFSLGTNGVWTYTASNTNPAIQALGVGDTLTETFTVTSADGTSSSVVVTINGTNDAAVISAGTGSVTEDVGVVGGNIATGGTLTISDADSGEASFTAQTTAGTYGSFSLGTNGVWTYTALNTNPAIQALGTGDTLTETFTVTSADGTTSSVVVTINGTNDAAVISAGTGSVTEDVGVTGGNIATGGTLTISDADGGEASFTAQTTAGTYGSFSLGTNGVWTYTAANSNPAIQALGAGQTLTETFTVRSTDGTTSSVVVTINGTNDAAVISAGTGSVTEDVGVVGGNIATGGTLTVTDADAGQASFQAQASTAGSYGTFTLGANGAWTYTAVNSNPAVQALGFGQTLTETFTVRSTDGTTSTVIVTINGTNDAAVISAGTGSVTEDVGVVGGNIATGGTLTVTDADSGQASFQPQPVTAGTYGIFTLTAGGAWTYTAANGNPAVQALGAGQTLTESFTVRSTDGTTSTVVVTINGTNDAPVAQAASVSVAEDAAIVNGAVTATDIDTGATRTFALNGAAPAGLTFNSNGTYSFNPGNAAYQSLAAGQTQVITVPYTVTDNAGATSTANLVITVTGVNDTPAIGGPLTGTVREDTTLTATGTLTITDADASQSSFVARTAVAGTYGSFSITTGGVWTYTLANTAANVQALPAGSSVTESFVVTSADGTPRTVVVTVNGINDSPIAQAASFSVAEDAAIVNGSVTATDVDTGSTLSFALNGAAPAGLTFNSNGTYSFNPANAAYQSLGFGQSQLITVPYTVTDNNGATSTANLVITVNGTNDAPVANVDTVAATEDIALTIAPATLLGNDTDIDSGDVLSVFSVQDAVGGTVALVGGNIVFTPTPQYSGAASFTYTVRDSQGASSTATVNVNVAAVADAPTLVIDTSTSTSGTVTSPALPPSTGLTRAFYDNIASVDTSNAGNISTLENAVENATPTSSSVVTNVSLATIGQDDAYRYTGYIFLQAGNTYTINGSRDDTLMVKLGGSQVYGVGYNNYGSFNATAFTPAVSGYYSIEVTAYNGDGPGDLDINMSVNGAAAVDLSTANFSLYANASGFAGGTVNGPLVPNNDGGYFPAVHRVGNEDTAIRLGSITASLNDTDGSETLSVSIGSIPAGAILSDGTNSFTAAAGSTSVNVTGWALNNLTLTPPANFSGNISLNVSATATEGTGATATTQSPLVVVVTPTVDAPVISGNTTIVTMAQGIGGQSTVNLPVLATLVDTDGSETLSIAISGVPTGATFNHGTSTGNGVWTFSAANLADLTMTLPAGYSSPSTGTALTVTVASTETASGSADSVSSTITLFADYTTSNTGGANNNANSLNGSGGNNYIDGLGGDDNISGNAGNDYIIGGSGADTLNGGSGNDMLLGGIGNDIILGGTGSDMIRGGAGNDTLTGGATAGAADATADVFAWSLADAGTAGARATDTITDFNVGAVSAGGDVLDLRDLLSGDVMGAGNTAGNLINFMEFEVSTTGGVTSTTIHISSTGQFAGGVYVAGQEDQAIVLQGVNLPTALGLGAGATDSQILQELLTRGKLIVDSAP